MKRQASLSEILMREFSPPLDSSLIAALLVDIETDSNGYDASPTQPQIDKLRAILRELAAQADDLQSCELSRLQLASPTDASSSSSSTPDFCQLQTNTSGSFTSDSSSFSHDYVALQLGFLQAALPDIPGGRLRDALALAERENDEPDLWDLISNILSDEAIRELDERGYEELDDDELQSIVPLDGMAWKTVEANKQKGPASCGSKTLAKKAKRGHKIALLDIRQQHHAQPLSSPKKSSPSAAGRWAVVMSVSEQLSQLLRSYPATYFHSYFHSPTYSTPYEALGSALKAMSDDTSSQDAEDSAVFFNLLDILMPECEEMLDAEMRSKLYSDLQLAISVTRGHNDDALDLVRILRDLDSDSRPGRMEMGIYHSPLQASSTCSPPPSPVKYLTNVSQTSTGPPSLPPPAENQNRRGSSESRWQTVHKRRYSGFGVDGRGNDLGRREMGDMSEVAECYRRKKEYLRKREELLREAYTMWRKGNAKSRGGEVAMYFANKAREFQDLAKKEALNAARAKVQAKRCASHEKDAVDLHGTTAAEAVVIVKEELENTTYTASRPLKIITGRGSHSVNQKSVLKPSIQKALDEDGWSISAWDGGLIVRGRKTPH